MAMVILQPLSLAFGPLACGQLSDHNFQTSRNMPNETIA
jgi:hypothetical protein